MLLLKLHITHKQTRQTWQMFIATCLRQKGQVCCVFDGGLWRCDKHLSCLSCLSIQCSLSISAHCSPVFKCFVLQITVFICTSYFYNLLHSRNNFWLHSLLVSELGTLFKMKSKTAVWWHCWTLIVDTGWWYACISTYSCCNLLIRMLLTLF